MDDVSRNGLRQVEVTVPSLVNGGGSDLTKNDPRHCAPCRALALPEPPMRRDDSRGMHLLLPPKVGAGLQVGHLLAVPDGQGEYGKSGSVFRVVSRQTNRLQPPHHDWIDLIVTEAIEGQIAGNLVGGVTERQRIIDRARAARRLVDQADVPYEPPAAERDLLDQRAEVLRLEQEVADLEAERARVVA